MALRLIHGPPNSGRVGLVLSRFRATLDGSPVLVVPNLDEAFRFEGELCADGCALGGSVTTFNGLFGLVAAASGDPAAPLLTSAQRLRVVAAAVEARRRTLGPLRRSSGRAGFAASLERLIGELQAAGLGPAEVEAGAATLEGSAYLGDLASLFAGYEEARALTGRADAHDVARRALALLDDDGPAWGERPVLIYGIDDLTANQFELLRGLSAVTEVTVAITHEDGRDVLGARSGLVGRLRKEIGVESEVETEADPGNTDSPLLFHLERNFGVPDAAPAEPNEDLVLLRSAGERGEAEAIGAHVSRLMHEGAEPERIAIVLRDPTRRGPLVARVLESYGVGVALEAELAVAATGVGGALLALLEAEHGGGRANDVLRWLRGPSGVRPSGVDWLERKIRRGRAQSAAEALELWGEGEDEVPYDLRRLRDSGPGGLAAAVGETATRMALRFLDGEGDGPPPAAGDGTELQAAAAISTALGQVSELAGLAPAATELIDLLRDLRFRAWIGPIEGRVRIADPQRLRAGRFDHVVIASLQDGEFPRRGGGDPFLSEAQRDSLGLDPRREDDAEERYLFYSGLSLARKTLALSYRDSDEAGAALARSPFLDDVRRLLAPQPEEGEDEVERRLTRDRGLADVVHRPSEAPSEDELARAAAAIRDPARESEALAEAAPVEEIRARVEARVAAARAVEAATRAPGPIVNPRVLAALRSVGAYGGTTLEGFDLCSYRWFVDHELDPRPLDPTPDAIVQGGLMHEVLERLYGERPGDEPLPTRGSLPAWEARGLELVAEIAGERLGTTPAERAMRRTVEGLLVRFLGEESERDFRGFVPKLLEARFGEGEDAQRPPLEIDGWRLHGAIDRVDEDGEGRALVHDYKVASRAAPAMKLEEEGKLQLQLYLIAAGELWGTRPIGALYHPLRATTSRQPRGLVLADEDGLPDLGLVGTDLLEPARFEALLDEARARAGEIVSRMRDGEIRRDPGPRRGLRDHDVCPAYCDFAPICRRDRAPVHDEDRDLEER
jgi:ATP-dependent helicase/DNAse subunit B